MEINDRVYGKIVIDEPVILELINSKPVQRLKGISQHGSFAYAAKSDVTRFDHSIGVMILLRKLGASIEEQIAGLLHDVPHTAFSHVVDFVFKNKHHDFHEKFHEKIILGSEIPEILKKYGYDVERILDEKNFPLLERDAPDLCADRIDYTLRDMILRFGFSEKLLDYVKHLIVRKDNDGKSEIIFDNQEHAINFAKDYLEMDQGMWAHIMNITLYQTLAEAIKIALEKDIIVKDDLFQDDNYVFDKLKSSGDKEINEYLTKLNPNIKVIDDPNNYDFFAKTKCRFVDPKFVNEAGNISKVTEVLPEFQNEINEHKERVDKGHFIKIISSEDNALPEIKLGKYRHFKGKEYRVLGVAHHSETLEKLVVYQALYESEKFGKFAIWVRPISMFFDKKINSEGKEVPRFEFVSED